MLKITRVPPQDIVGHRAKFKTPSPLVPCEEGKVLEVAEDHFVVELDGGQGCQKLTWDKLIEVVGMGKIESRVFEGDLAVAGRVTANNTCYTDECLKKAAEEWDRDRVRFGGVGGGALTGIMDLSKVAFTIEDVDFDEGVLSATGKPIGGPQGEMLSAMLDAEEQRPGMFDLGMAVTVDEKDLERRGAVITVKRCKLEIVSFLPAKEKA